ncbi:tRNA (carboxymethyluridine(34)-5-O)-methyltransferase [Colletotrichum chlorophyti]|uniref:tRNA (Carboxymethyluridine(34)-5-O)-methyltransferase n=1 Tax=Colletotrichum chlorophyti TaxID=708187 RepID=A0A1Q8S1S5_9PEZI|nr:tRNA (carboxymethyluridine(34)-5-O)-methyltransferase [Colletotrichum chlorophyti]
MSASSGPQPGGPGHPPVPAAEPRQTDLPSALGDCPSSSSSPAIAQQQNLDPQQSSSPSDHPAEDAESYESRHVHNVYDAIAPHFSSTRYKPWPVVSSFLLSLPPGSIGLDAGCGNGKYLSVNPSLFILASDRSPNLVSLARHYQPPPLETRSPATAPGPQKKNKSSKAPVEAQAETVAPPPPSPNNQVLVADSLALPYRPSSFDFAISIAVIHHLSTPARRRAALAALLSAVRPVQGKVLVFVWALEQGSSRRGWDAGAAQDQLVPWVTKGKKEQKERPAQDATFHRYYHLYREGELEEDVVAVGGRVLDSGYDRDNWWAIFSRDS